MAGLDNDILISVFTDNPPVPAAGFGVPRYLAAPGTLGGGFTERVRFYENTAAVATDLASGDITASVSAALVAAFSQEPKVVKYAVGRVEAGIANIQTVRVNA